MNNPSLILEDVTMRFGGLTAVNQVNLTIPLDRVTGIIGPNGAGKTTLFNVMSGIYKPTSGKITFMDQVISGLPSNQVSRVGMARTFQHPRLFKDMTAMENLRVGFHIQTQSNLWDVLSKNRRTYDDEELFRKRAPELLELVSLHGKAEEKAKNLSYGEQRRLEIARALALSPKLLLLDEPLAGLGDREIQDVVEAIRQVRSQDIGIVLIEHHVATVMAISDYLVVVNFGSIIGEGTPEQVKANPLVIEAYLGTEVE